jgi:hypothetical protein
MSEERIKSKAEILNENPTCAACADKIKCNLIDWLGYILYGPGRESLSANDKVTEAAERLEPERIAAIEECVKEKNGTTAY